MQIGLNQDDDDRPDVLEDKEAQRDAAGHGVELKGLLKELDHQEGGGTADDDANVGRAQPGANDGAEADEFEQRADQRAEGDDQREGG